MEKRCFLADEEGGYASPQPLFELNSDTPQTTISGVPVHHLRCTIPSSSAYQSIVSGVLRPFLLRCAQRSSPHTRKPRFSGAAAFLLQWSLHISSLFQMAPRKRPNVNSESQECNMSKKKTRGASLLKDLTKSIGNGNHLSVEFKRNGQVIGENRAKLSSYIGTVENKWVPITVDDWRLVSQEQRDNIWQNVLVKSQKYRELAKQNKNSYRASRKGYVGVEEAYKDEHNMEATSDVSRAILWIEARKYKNGDICEEAMPVVEKLHHLMEQKSSGNLTTVGQKDVLALALNKMEHPGRVRGVGQDITIRKHWPRSSKASSSKTLVEDETVISGLKEQIKVMEATFGSKISALENVIEKLVAERVGANEVRPPVEKHVVISPNDEVPRPQSGKASCSVLKKATIASEELASMI